MKKLILLGAAATGYVLGARAGRGRYEEIRDGARRIWSDPRVQEGAGKAQEAAREAGEDLRDRATERTSGSHAAGTNHV